MKKGTKFTKEHKEKLSLSHKGQTPWNKGKKLPNQTGEKHFRWKGNEAEYTNIHSWVRRWKGKPDHCEVCGSTKRRMYHWSNIDHKYKRILEDYISMCVPCHKKYDLKLIADNNKE